MIDGVVMGFGREKNVAFWKWEFKLSWVLHGSS